MTAAVYKAKWETKVKCLGIKLSNPLQTGSLVALNLLPVIYIVRNQLAKWEKLGLSWFGKIADAIEFFVSVSKYGSLDTPNQTE